MRPRNARLRPAPAAALLALALLAFRGTAPGQPLFTLASQNCLHLGQGRQPYQQNKEPILSGVFANFDVVVLQEVMAQANVGNVTPGTHYYIATPVQGPTTYKEAYAFLINNAIPVVPANSYAVTGTAGFARPPAGVLVVIGGVCTWVVDYHAVYGRSIGVRRAEVNRIPQVYQGFQGTVVNGATCDRVVIGGDWNLAANDPVFQNFITNGWAIGVQPVAKTSLKRNGGLSQPYDHFLWDTATTVNVVNPLVIPVPTPPGTPQGWRNQVSDHLGIACQVY